jgi:hypothetical protein
MRPEDVVTDLGWSGETKQVVAALEKLVEWGNLCADPDTSRVTTVEDFHRARYLYQLTTAERRSSCGSALHHAASRSAVAPYPSSEKRYRDWP